MQVIANIYILLHYWIINGHAFTITFQGGAKTFVKRKITTASN